MGPGSGVGRRPGSVPKVITCDNNNTDTSEWTARTEEMISYSDPFGEQSTQPPNDSSSSSSTTMAEENEFKHRRTIIRKVGLKRNNVTVPLDSKVKLDRVLGLTVSSSASLDCDPFSGTVVYPSGCVLVLYNQRRNKQTHIINALKKPITACKFSKDGRYIVTGECGHQPHVRVWEVATGEQLASLARHRNGINCVAFSPDTKYVVSVGSQHDMLVTVWDWKNNLVVASNKVSVKVKAISFSEEGDYFVTVGNRYVKFWYMDYNDSVAKNKFESLPLMGRNAILGDQRNNYFCDVGCGKGDAKESTFAITKSGLLCEFNNRRLLNKWVELKTESANCLSISQQYICVGCAQGVIRCFKPQTLEFVCTLPRPHVLGLDIAKGFTAKNDFINPLNNKLSTKPKYADAVAVVYDEANKIVTSVYSDRSIYFWTLGDIKRIGKLNSFLNHSSCIWDIEVYPQYKNANPLLPPGTFLTCSSDDTIRIWNTEFEQNNSAAKHASYIYKRNFFSQELLKILYMDPELAHLCDSDLVHTSRGSSNVSNGANGVGNNKEDTSYDTKNGVRTIKFSTDGKHLASGDRCGNIRIFDLEQQRELFKIEAHDAEVLCLEYSNEDICGRALLVSASRDRFIHIYDVHRQYSCIQNIDDHSSSIMSVKFVCDRLNSSFLQLISCGADKSLIFRKQIDHDSDFRLEHHVAGKSTFYDMAVDENKNQVITVSQDRLIRVYDSKTSKACSSFKGSLGEEGALIKIAFDPSTTFIATSCTDKSIYIFDYQTGECLATSSGHSELVTGLKFTQDGRHLISVSGDGCIFVWRLPVEMTNAIASKLGLPLISDNCQTTITNRVLTLPLQSVNEPNYRNSRNEVPHQNNAQATAYKFNANSLPSWAKKQFESHSSKSEGLNNAHDDKESSKTLPRGRWAQRVLENGPSDLIVNQGLVKSYANTFESLASRSTPTTPSGTSSPTLRELKMSRAHALATPTRERAKSSLSSGVEDDEDDRATTDSDNTCSQESSYKVTKVSNSSQGASRAYMKHNGGQFSMVSSMAMSIANINDLPYDEEEDSVSGLGNDSDKNQSNESKNRYNSLYMSTEHLERIDQRNRYLKNMYENIDKNNFENNANSASDDSGINQIDHSLGSSSTTTNNTLLVPGAPQPACRQSLSSKFNKGAVLSNSNKHAINYTGSDGGSDDATLSDVTDINQDPTDMLPSALEQPKFLVLDTINETSKEENCNSNGGGHEIKLDMAAISQPGFASIISDSTTTTAPSTPNTVLTATSSSVTLNQPSMSKKREELAKTINDAKRKLESLTWKGSSLTNSKSVANLRDPDEEKEDDDKSYRSLSFDAFRKSISLNDLSASQTLPKRLSVYRANAAANRASASSTMNNYQFAPLWDSRRTGAMPATNSGSLSRTPSSNTLNKVDMMRSQSTLCRQGLWSSPVTNGGPPPLVMHPSPNQTPGLLKPPNGHMVNTPNGGTLMINPRSGRSSAPPSQFRKAASATVSCASSRRGDSTEDDEELESAINSDDDNSDEHRTLRPRPVTPPKPNILKQIRRGSNASNHPNSAPQPYGNGHYTQHQATPSGQGHSSRPRRLWSTDTMRSSKSEFNLANIGRDTPARRRNDSSTSSNVWPQYNLANDRMDLYMTNPSSIPLSLDLCQHLINEMNFLTNYASRIYERASYSNNMPIVEYLKETMGQVSRDIQLIMSRPTTGNTVSGTISSKMPQVAPVSAVNNTTTSQNGNFNSLANITPETEEMFQQFLTYLSFTKKVQGNSSQNNSQQQQHQQQQQSQQQTQSIGETVRSNGTHLSQMNSSGGEHHFSS